MDRIFLKVYVIQLDVRIFLAFVQDACNTYLCQDAV